jgi:NADH-quinone oxidoreductase subunit N
MTMTAILEQLAAFALLPEIALTLVAISILMVGVFATNVTYAGIKLMASVGILATVILVARTAFDFPVVAFNGSIIVDDFGRAMKVLILLGTDIALLLSGAYMARRGILKFEYPALVLLSAVGMMLMVSANDLISLYVGLEMQSLALYVIATIDRDDAKSSEAGLKYFVLGALASGMLLYGASMLYGTAGTTQFAGISQHIQANGSSIGLIIGIVFLSAGLAFKVSAVPFHMWTPDVYEGSPTPVTAFFAAAPKVAAIALFSRVLSQPLEFASKDWQQIIVFISIASMLLGAFAAIGQTNIKRLLAYSSIGHMGYALVGLAAATEDGIQGIVLYMLIYSVTTVGVFACVLSMRRQGKQVETIGDLAGLAQTSKWHAAAMAIMMFSLAGIPPLAGFFGKLYVFMSAVRAELYWLAVIGVLTSVVGAFYYIRIVKLMYFDDPVEAFDVPDREVKYVAIFSSAFALAFIVFAQPLVAYAETAARSLFLI